MATASPQTQLKEGTQSPNLHVLWKRQLGFSGEQTSFKKAVSVSFLPADWAAQGLTVAAVHSFVHCSSLSYCFGFACKVRVKQEKKRERTSTLQKPVSCRTKTKSCGSNHILPLHYSEMQCSTLITWCTHFHMVRVLPKHAMLFWTTFFCLFWTATISFHDVLIEP